MKRPVVTTSWDDGHVLDMRLAALLKKYAIKGSFYIAPRDFESAKQDRLTDAQIQELSQEFEIGAHTMTHRNLTDLGDAEAKKEIEDSKTYLEDVTGKPVQSFCYPRGNYAHKHVEMVQAAGFTYARTVRRYSFSAKPALEAKTTLHCYDHWSDLWDILVFSKFNIFTFFRYYRHWDLLAKALFDRAVATNGSFHLWGHSWEIDMNKDWERLEGVLKYISGRDGVDYATNGELPVLEGKKVLLVTPYFPPQLGGVEMYVFNMATQLRAHGWDVVVATTQKGVGMSSTVEQGLRIYHLPYLYKAFNTPLNPLWYFQLRNIMRIERPDIVNAHAPVVFLSDVAAIASGGIPFVLTYHAGTMQKNTWFADLIIGLYETIILPATVRRAKKIICSSQFVRNSIFARCNGKVAVVTPGVDVEAFTEDISIQKNQHEITFICSLARMHKLKGFHVLTAAIELLAPKMPDISLKVVGEKGTTSSSRVRFVGPKKGKELVREIQTTDVLVLPSLAPAESFGMVLIEAMACAVPVIGTEAGGIPEVVRDGEDGYIVPPGDPARLAHAIEILLSDPAKAKRMGMAGRAKVEREFAWKYKVAQTIDIYEACI